MNMKEKLEVYMPSLNFTITPEVSKTGLLLIFCKMKGKTAI